MALRSAKESPSNGLVKWFGSDGTGTDGVKGGKSGFPALGVDVESDTDTRSTPKKLVTTAPTLARVNVSTLKTRPMANVKKPLMLDKIVALATLVKPRLAFTLQLAMNQNKQNTEASLAVSRKVRGVRSSDRFT